MEVANIFSAFVASHALGDFLLQTDFQAVNKQRGLGPDPTSRRALAAHLGSYGVAFVPALAYLAAQVSVGWALLVAVAILGPHAVQDDGRLLIAYQERVKKLHDPPAGLRMLIDQAGHVVALFLAALLAVA